MNYACRPPMLLDSGRMLVLQGQDATFITVLVSWGQRNHTGTCCQHASRNQYVRDAPLDVAVVATAKGEG